MSLTGKLLGDYAPYIYNLVYDIDVRMLFIECIDDPDTKQPDLRIVFPEIISYSETNEQSQPDDEYIDDIVSINEIEKGKNLNVELLKDMADGSVLENQVMYGTVESILVQGKIFMTFNNSPFFVLDEGMKRKFIQMSFNSKFHESEKNYKENKHKPLQFMADHQLKSKIKQLRNAVVSVMAEYAHKYYTEKWVTPKCVTEQTEETCGDNSTFTEIWESLDKSPGLYLPKARLMAQYEKENFKILKDEFKKKGIKYDSQKKHDGCKGCLIGVAFQKGVSEGYDSDPNDDL